MTAARSAARTVVLAATCLGLFPGVLAGCGGRPGDRPAGSGTAPATVTGDVTVFAAASLTESFTRIGRDFERANPKARVRFSFAASSTLAAQITRGAPADVFAAASPATMKTVTDAGAAAGPPMVFTRNQLVIAVPDGNPKHLTTLADLARPGVTVALCAKQVPCGAAAAKVLSVAGVALTPVTLEADVKAALSKVKLGEVDAALVYRTDTNAAASSVDGIEFPESDRASTEYPIVVVADAPNPGGGRAFAEAVRSEAGRSVLVAAGFLVP